MNRNGSPVTFKLKQGDRIIKPTMPAHAIISFIFFQSLLATRIFHDDTHADAGVQEESPAAVAVRAHDARRCFLAHMDFRLDSAPARNFEFSPGLAGLRASNPN
jgi:hypothetical protein